MKQLLDGLADELTSANVELPLDLVSVCGELGVGLRIAPADGPRRGALLRSGRSWEVAIMRRDREPAPITASERFTIAHELGHFLLLQHAQFQPRREAEYWLGEQLCNHFASRLLIPPRLLADIPEPTDATELANIVNRIAMLTNVTAEPAARAACGCLSTPVAAGTFRLDALASTRRLGFRCWWTENRRWWAAHGGRRLAVYVNHALAPALETMYQMTLGDTAAVNLDGASSTLLRRRGGPLASFAAILDPQ